MNLMKKNSYGQHIALQRLETAGEEVLYVTSQVPTPAALSDAFLNQRVVQEATALFRPGDINLPDLTKQHWVSFEANASHGFMFSEEGIRFERSVRDVADLVDKRLLKERVGREQNRQRLTKIVSLVSAQSLQARRISQRFKDPVVQASVIAAYVLDAHLTFFNEVKAPSAGP